VHETSEQRGVQMKRKSNV